MSWFWALRDRRAGRYGFYLVLLAGLAALIWVILWPGATWLAGDLAAMPAAGKTDALNGARQTLIQLIGVFSLIVAAASYFATRRAQYAERLNKSASALSSSDISERVSAIHAIRDILRESPDQHFATISALTAFVRNRAPRNSPDTPPVRPQDDVAAAMAVLARRPNRPEPKNLLDLRGTELSYLQLPDARLRSANFTGARLASADLKDADLTDAVFDGADLSGADLDRARLVNASIRDAQLTDVRMSHATLTGAVIKADLTQALLIGCRLNRAWLFDSVLTGTDLAGADLTGTLLAGDLHDCQNLSERQMLAALPFHPRLPARLENLPAIRDHLEHRRQWVPPPQRD